MVLQRERLHALIDARLPGAVWLHGPTGAGKTVLLRTWLQRGRLGSFWLTVDERHRDPAALFAALTANVAAQGNPLLPAFSPEHRDEPSAFAKGYFARLDQALPDACAVVIDDVHHLAGTTATLFAQAIDAFGGRRTLCFASQLRPDTAFAPQLAGSRLSIIGHRSLAFDAGEARDLALQLGGAASAPDALVDATDGWAAGLMLAMQFGASGGSGDGTDDPLENVRTPLALLIASQVLGGVDRSDLARLRLLAELPQVPMELPDIASDWAGACGRLQGLADRGLFVERLTVDRSRHAMGEESGPHPLKVTRISKGCWRLHDLMRNALREPGAIGEPDPLLGTALIAHLLKLDRLDLAWQIAARLGATVLGQVVGLHGSTALRDGHLLDLLQMAAPHADRSTPVIALWYARALIGIDNAAALRACDEGFLGFEIEGDANGAALASALALFVVFATMENVGQIAVWQQRFARVEPDSLERVTHDEELALRVAGEVVHDLLIGGRSRVVVTANDLQDRLMGQVSKQVLSANETILAGSLLVAAMRRAIRVQDVEMAILRVEGLASFKRSAPHIRASWSIENGYHFTRVGLPGRARQAFDGALVVAEENTLLQPRLGATIGLARLELGLGDLVRARQHVEDLEVLGQDRLGRQAGWVQHLRARIDMLSGHAHSALMRMDHAQHLIFEAGFPPSTTVILDQDRIQMLYASGAVADSLALARKVMESVRGEDGRRIDIVLGLIEAHSVWHDDRDKGVPLLRRHLLAARSLNLMTFFSLLPEVAAQIAAHGLRAGIEVDFLIRVIRLRNLSAPTDAPDNWPWPVRVEVLRPFRIVMHGDALAFSGKAQQKPLELLKYLACHRGFIADSPAVAGALWPDAEEPAARKSLEVTISRLRKLLVDESLVVVKEGKVSLDARRVSSDAREFIDATLAAEGVAGGKATRALVVETGDRLLALFHEMPLEHEESTAWRESVRERFRTSFVRAVRTLIAYWTDAGDASRASTLIEAALAREPLAENLYRLLIEIHLDAGNHTEAMRVYRQCRQMLSVLIGAQPSAETERLKRLIQL